MYRALTGFADRMPARPETLPTPVKLRLERGMRRILPARHGGFTQKTTIGGHRLFMRTGEYEDGTLGELSLTPTRESGMVRGLMESFGDAVSIGLQYGAPLEAYVENFAYSCFGPAGTVEGDPVASYATSMLDYAFRPCPTPIWTGACPMAPTRTARPNRTRCSRWTCRMKMIRNPHAHGATCAWSARSRFFTRNGTQRHEHSPIPSGRTGY